MKITLVLPDGTRQPIEVSEQATLQRLLPALAAKIALPRRDEAGTAVAYYATYQDTPLPDDQPLTSLNIPDDAELVLHPVAIPDPHEAIDLEPSSEPTAVPPQSTPSTPPRSRSQQRRPFRARVRQIIIVGCTITSLVCCLSIILIMGLIRTLSNDDLETTPTSTIELNGNSVLWDFDVQDVEYSQELARLILVSANPPQLHIYDPSTRQDQITRLRGEPTAVSVSPDGSQAAVGYGLNISLVDLQTQQTGRSFNTTSITVADIVLSDEWIFVTGAGQPGGQLYATRIDSTVQGNTLLTPIKDHIHSLKLAADGRSLYGTFTGSEPGKLERFDITHKIMGFMYDSGDVADTCGEVWLAENGIFAFTGCGHVWRLADQRQNDMVLLRNFFDTPQKITTLAHSTTTDRILLITEANDTQILIFDSDGSNLLATENLPEGTHGRYLFINSQGTQYYAIIQTDDGQFGLVFGGL